MRERPILFSGPMVRALLAGTKTVTRRICTHRHGIRFVGGLGQQDDPECWGYAFDGPDHHGWMVLARGHDDRHDHGLVSIPSPYGAPGDRLWVRETLVWEPTIGRAFFAADGDQSKVDAWPWQRPVLPSIHMPRGASRITLEVVDVRVERLHEITEEDARREGAEKGFTAEEVIDRAAGWPRAASHRSGFRLLWEEINGAGSWAANPWVWRVEFRRVER